jgi:hypothetical protein
LEIRLELIAPDVVSPLIRAANGDDMGLAEYCAYWFVRRALGKPSDNEVPANDPLPDDIVKTELARKLTAAVNEVQMRVWPTVVLIDGEKLASASADWTREAEVAADLIRAARSAKSSDVNLSKGFADYIVTRWIHRYVFHSDIRVRPLDQELPHYGDQERRLLAEAMNLTVTRCGLTVDKAGIDDSLGKWKRVSDVRGSYLKNVT